MPETLLFPTLYQGDSQPFIPGHSEVLYAEAAARQERKFSDVLMNTVDALIVALDRQGRIVRFNQACEAMTGYRADEVEGIQFWQVFIPKEDQKFFQDYFVDIDSLPFPFRRENVWVTKAGDSELICWSNAALRDASGKITQVIATGLRMAERMETEEALREAERNYRSIFENALEGIFQTTPEGNYLRANPALARIYGYASPDELIGSLRDITRQLYVDPQRRTDFIQLMQERDAVSGFEAQIYRKDGRIIWIMEHARAVRDADGTLLYYEGTVQDITEQKDLQAEKERLLVEALERADHDPLTGLLNHRAFHNRYQEEAERAQREGTSLAVAVLDLDNFKFFNDSYGHAVGDEVLRRVAETLRGCCRRYDVLARFGGDEFALLMPHTTREAAEQVAERLKTALEGVGYRPAGSEAPIPLTLSVGLAMYPEDGDDHHAVLEIADARLLRTKTGGSDKDSDSLRLLLTDSFQGFSMLDALVTAVDNKDRYTRKHSEDVMRYALQIARRMRLDENTQQIIQVAALLHDVGKIGIPDRILRKPGRLLEEEFEAVRQHPMMGAAIVGAVPGFEETLESIRHHHERWDGDGYPCGLRGEKIPLPARIMAVADAYSAMTTDRPYRKGMEPAKAQGILEQGAGTQWDPACVQAFCSICCVNPCQSQTLRAA